MSIKEIRKALQKIGFKQWQIKTTIHTNEVRVVILLADLAKNIQVVENKMLTLGWTKARISESTIVQGIKLRIMYFVPQHPISFLS
jgi:predicted RNA binding protein YcfA (HicA-like mRNA interferase family)